jgi:acylphosphatase
MMVARKFTIAGRVQRVGFRWFTIEAASREGVTGWVQNLPDGRVEVLVEGDSDAVERFERAVRMGPASARVEAVETDILAPTGRFHGFSAR